MVGALARLLRDPDHAAGKILLPGRFERGAFVVKHAPPASPGARLAASRAAAPKRRVSVTICASLAARQFWHGKLAARDSKNGSAATDPCWSGRRDFDRTGALEQAAADFVATSLEDPVFKIIFADDHGGMSMNVHQQAFVASAHAMAGIVPRMAGDMMEVRA